MTVSSFDLRTLITKNNLTKTKDVITIATIIINFFRVCEDINKSF